MEELNVNQTEQTNEVVQENDGQVEQPKVEETQTSNESPVEGSTTDVKPQECIVEPPKEENSTEGQPMTSEEIQKRLDKLKEYEVKDNELNELRNRLGSQAPQDNTIFQARQQLAMVENLAQQEYIKLCNEYGVDYRPDMIDKSSQALKEKDPQAYYDLKYKLNNICDGLEAKRNEVEGFVNRYELNNAIERNRKIFDTSPAVSTVMDGLLKEGFVTAANMDTVIQNYMMPIMREAYEAGRQSVAQTPPSPAKVLNNSVITQQQATPLPQKQQFTLDEIASMDSATYKKYQAEIDKLFLR